MTKLNFKYSAIQSIVVPSILNTNDNLQDTINVFHSMIIPSSFRYATYLNDCKTSFINTKNKLQDIHEWLEESNRSFTKTLDMMNSFANALDKPVIKIKESVIKE